MTAVGKTKLIRISALLLSDHTACLIWRISPALHLWVDLIQGLIPYPTAPLTLYEKVSLCEVQVLFDKWVWRLGQVTLDFRPTPSYSGNL